MLTEPSKDKKLLRKVKHADFNMFAKNARWSRQKVTNPKYRNLSTGTRIRTVFDFRCKHPKGMTDADLTRAFGFYKKVPPLWDSIYHTLNITDTVGKDLKEDLTSYFNIFAIHGRFPTERPKGASSFIYRMLTPQAFSIIKYGTIAGFDRKKIAEMIGITEGQLSDWVKRFPEVRNALLNGKDLADMNVVKAAYRRATGMGLRDTYFAAYQGEVVAKPYIKYYPPNPQSIELWLKHNKGWAKETSGDDEERGLIMESLEKTINEPIPEDELEE